MNTLCENVLETAEMLLDGTRAKKEAAKIANNLAGRINFVNRELELVTGEIGRPDFYRVLGLLVDNDVNNPLHRWMLSETAAAGVAAVHEWTTGEVVTIEHEVRLAERLMEMDLPERIAA